MGGSVTGHLAEVVDAAELAAVIERLASLRAELAAEKANRAALIAELRAAGATWKQAGQAVGLSAARCHAIAGGRAEIGY